ncbi:hypothetical protein CYMTET_9550 [Cymbomonas tetramitiformis]|uniref:Uncharacterized protein n=1 Tax=Cymbomonas tetramitiformis TaxID=36881 RepID=A0AAE0LEX1_9CHLO|nr:hypothetical protein CYMTET_9550 [Cymbomonas tetramitiformis]
MYFNQQEYDDEQSFRPSALKFICTREVIELTPAGKATTRALRQPSSEEYCPVGKPRCIDTAYDIHQRFCAYLASHMEGVAVQ